MAVYSSNAKAGPFIANGEQTAFPFSFRCIAPSDIVVYKGNVAVPQTEYEVVLRDDTSDGLYDGGVVTFQKAPLADDRIIIVREVPITQETDIQNNTAFYPELLENAYDKLTMICQQLAEGVSRALKVGVGDAQADPDSLLQAVYGAAESAGASATSAANAASLAGEKVDEANRTLENIETTADEVYAKFTEALESSAGMPIGTIFPFPASVPPEGAYLLNGQTIANCRELYPKFWQWVNTAGVRRIETDTYEAELASAGVCGGFVISASGSVRLPDLRNGTLWGADSPTIGQSLAAGLPNITGNTGYINVNDSEAPFAGALYASGDIGTSSAGTGQYGHIVYMDASRSNAIYGNSDTVQPPAIRVSFCIQVFNAATALSEQESAQLASEMQMKAQTDFGNVAENLDFIVKHEEAADGSWWYDLYRSGKVVQGGRTTPATAAGGRTVTMPIEMADTNYTPLVTINGIDAFHTAGGALSYASVTNLTETTFDVYESTAAGVKSHFWRVEGKAATE